MKDQLVSLVEKIIRAEGTEQEINAWLALLEKNIPVPTGYISGLIFWPGKYGLGATPSAEEIVDKALSYNPLQL